MKVYVTKASDFNFKKVIQIDTLEELLRFQQEVGHDLIIEEMESFDEEIPINEFTIMIYDDYLE